MRKETLNNNYISLLPILRCPVCRGKITERSSNFMCDDCRHLFEIINNVPCLYDEQVAGLDDESIQFQKRRQLEFHQRTDYAKEMTSGQLSEFMITRPYGHSRFFTKMWEYPLITLTKKVHKLFQGTLLFNGLSVLDIGCGGGLEACFLAKRGASIVGIDIAPLHCEASIKRFTRCGLDGVFIQADATNLPFCDLAFDMVITHDSLHHLPQVQMKKAVEEYCRVSKRIVCFLEANNSILTKVLVKLGLSSTVESSGNKIIRFTRNNIDDFLKETKYKLVTYNPMLNKKAQFPKHFYKKPMSYFPLFHVYWGFVSLANFFVGNFVGNEMVAIATKEEICC